MSTYTKDNEPKYKFKLLVKRPCDSNYSVFMVSENLNVIKHGFYVANHYGWQSKMEL